MDYDCPDGIVERACALTPGIESPTISPLRDQGWVAIRAMVPRSDSHRRMDELYALGCRGILVTEIAACRL
jgi:ATP phosphoribosyltransferase